MLVGSGEVPWRVISELRNLSCELLLGTGLISSLVYSIRNAQKRAGREPSLPPAVTKVFPVHCRVYRFQHAMIMVQMR